MGRAGIVTADHRLAERYGLRWRVGAKTRLKLLRFRAGSWRRAIWSRSRDFAQRAFRAARRRTMKDSTRTTDAATTSAAAPMARMLIAVVPAAPNMTKDQNITMTT